MELNEMEKRLLFQVEGDYQSKILNELYMTARYTKNLEQRKAAENLMEKLRVLTDAECMDIVRDIQKNYRLPYPPRTIGEKIAEARQQSGAEKLKGHDIMALERFDPEVAFSYADDLQVQYDIFALENQCFFPLYTSLLLVGVVQELPAQIPDWGMIFIYSKEVCH